MTLINILLVVFSFLIMEGVAWFTHKYVMHGFLWNLHKSHHDERKTRFEKNDLFAIFFSMLAIGLIYSGTQRMDFKLYMGIGITLYGIGYFLFHDVYVHQRIKAFRNFKGEYLELLKRAHKKHHKNLTKENNEFFGFLFISSSTKEKLTTKRRN